MLFDVKWRRPGDPEILECHGLLPEQLVFRIRGVIRMCGSVELLSVTFAEGGDLINTEYGRRAKRHLELGNQYAEQSHEFEGELSDHYSSLAEAHQGIAAVFSKLAGEKPLEEEHEP
jgi:light-regulated signal transduction histidine kinase (bacteriophytochrome)